MILRRALRGPHSGRDQTETQPLAFQSWANTGGTPIRGVWTQTLVFRKIVLTAQIAVQCHIC
jgi:hypothetical protein